LEEVRLPGGTAEVGDFTPENLKDEVPVLLAQAWGLGLETYKPAMKQLFEDKRRVFRWLIRASGALWIRV